MSVNEKKWLQWILLFWRELTQNDDNVRFLILFSENSKPWLNLILAKKITLAHVVLVLSELDGFMLAPEELLFT